MKRILFLAADLCSGGAERQMVTTACLLKKEGYEVVMYCYAKADFYAPILQEAGIPVVWKIETTNYLKRINLARKYIRNNSFNAVISFLPSCNFLNNIVAVGGHKWKVITGVRSADKSYFASKRGKFFSWFQRFSDVIICNSQNACNMWREQYPSFTEKLNVIYNCVQLGRVQSKYEPKQDGKLHIIIAATYQYLKNPLGLVDALAMMDEREKNEIVIDWYGRIEMSKGDTQAYDDTVKAIQNHALERVVNLHPDTKEIADQMHQADAVMLLSKFEGLPNAICEGMLLGKPIIMTRVSDYDVLVDESNGFLCDWDKPETIKMAILSMVKLPTTKLLEMGKESEKKAKTLFTPSIIVKQWMKIIDQ